MNHAATLRRFYDLINAGDIDGAGEPLADDLLEHEETPGLEPTKEGADRDLPVTRQVDAQPGDVGHDPDELGEPRVAWASEPQHDEQQQPRCGAARDDTDDTDADF